MRWIIAFSLVAAPDVRANDGFYQGSAFSVVPVKMSGVAVVREKLVIEPIEHPKCYKLVGVPSKDKKECYTRMNLKPLPSCQTNPATGRLDGAIFAPHWRAHAEYEVTASRDIVDAQMGFPIPNWDHSYQCDKADGREDALTDGITDFHVWRNGTEIKGLRRGSLKAVPNLMLSEGAKSYAGYLWKTGFKKGEKSSFVVDYAFGLMYNAEFFSRDRQPQQYGESQSVTHFNEKPWFLTLPIKSCWYSAASVDYILTPINLWGNRPPEEIRIELKTGKLPSRFLVPYYPAPECVDRDKMVFHFKQTRPNAEFRVSYPDFSFSDIKCPAKEVEEFFQHPLQSVDQWKAWRTSLGSDFVKFTCGLLDDLKAGADPQLAVEIAKAATDCRASCD